MQKSPICHRKTSYVPHVNALYATEKCPMCHGFEYYITEKSIEARNVQCSTEKHPMCHRKMPLQWLRFITMTQIKIHV